MKSYFCTNKDCKYYLKPCSITFDEDGDGYMGPILCKCCRGLAMTKESLSTANLGRAGVSIEAEAAKQSYQKGYNEGFYDAAKEIKRLLDAAVQSYQEIAEEKLKEINKYWKDKTNEKTPSQRVDKKDRPLIPSLPSV